MRWQARHTSKLFGLVLALGIMIMGGFYVSQNAQAATMTDYDIAKTDPLNLAYHMDEPLYTAIYNTYNNTGSPQLDADQDGVITLAESGGWSGTQIYLPNQGIAGTLRGLERLTGVQALYLFNNSFTGEIPANLGDMAGLTSLQLYNNQLSGPIPDSIVNLTELTNVYLQNNQLSGPIPSSIGNLTKLTILVLNANQLTGSIPSSIADLTNLTILQLNANQLSGPIHNDIGNLTELTSLTLQNNQLTGVIPNSIGSLTKLVTLYLQNNQLTGSIPSGIGNLTELTSLQMHYNQLAGSIPSSIGNLTKLQGVLYLCNNQLSGSIPDSIGNLTSLTGLALYNNQLTGSIPGSIGNITGLTSLSVFNNKLTGSVPDSIGSLTSLTDLQLAQNNLSGSIPASFANLSNLTAVNISYNDFSGTLPDIATGSPGLGVIVVFNNDLITPACSSIPYNYTNFTNYYTAKGNEECAINTPSVNTNYATTSPQDGGPMVLRQDVNGDGRATVNLQSSYDGTTGYHPSQNIDVNGDGVADINIIVFPELMNASLNIAFNAGTAITVSDGFAGWIPANMSLGAGTWTKADFRVSQNYPYYLEAVTPGALVPNANPAPVILNITQCGTNNDINGDGVPDYNIDINNDGIVDYRPFDTCPSPRVVGAPNTGVSDELLNGKIAILLLCTISAAVTLVGLLIGRRLMKKEIK